MKHPFRSSFWISFLTLTTIFGAQFSQVNLTDPIEQVRSFTRMDEFDYTTWTLDAILLKTSQSILNLPTQLSDVRSKQIVQQYAQAIRLRQDLSAVILQIHADPNISEPDQVSASYKLQLADVNRLLDHISPVAESILQTQTSSVISSFKLSFGGQLVPELLFHATPLPYALIVSPRDVIRQDVNISLRTNLTLDEMIKLEDRVRAGLNVSALVEEVGGIGTYPTMIQESGDLNWVAEVIAHEWVHNYLTLRPLGINYDTNSELRTMNETTASIAGKEIAAAVISTYYPELAPAPIKETAPSQEPQDSTSEDVPVESEPVFDFRAVMHETRVHVDELLSAGKIEEAESYMEVQRKYIWENGYQIRKLNQAYFAFHGAYADSPGGAAGSDPVGPAVRALRDQSTSLAEFVNEMSWMTSFTQLESKVNENSTGMID